MKCTKGNKNYYVDDNYLDKINNEDKAYFLGWMFSDGYIVGNRIIIKLKKDDGYIIKLMYDKFSSGYNLLTYGTCVMIGVSSNKIVDNLIKLGCVYNKTINGFSIPDIPNELFNHYLRGYFDGDGSIGIRTSRANQIQINICSINEKFLIEIKNKLVDFNIYSKVLKETRKNKTYLIPDGRYISNCKDMFRLVISSHKERLKFYEFLYTDSTIKLERKFSQYNNYYKRTISLLEAKNSKIITHFNDKTIINYDLIMANTFNNGNEVDVNNIIMLYNSGICEYQIHKQTKISRSVVKRIIKENNN